MFLLFCTPHCFQFWAWYWEVGDFFEFLFVGWWISSGAVGGSVRLAAFGWLFWVGLVLVFSTSMHFLMASLMHPSTKPIQIILFEQVSVQSVSILSPIRKTSWPSSQSFIVCFSGPRWGMGWALGHLNFCPWPSEPPTLFIWIFAFFNFLVA